MATFTITIDDQNGFDMTYFFPGMRFTQWTGTSGATPGNTTTATVFFRTANPNGIVDTSVSYRHDFTGTALAATYIGDGGIEGRITFADFRKSINNAPSVQLAHLDITGGSETGSNGGAPIVGSLNLTPDSLMSASRRLDTGLTTLVVNGGNGADFIFGSAGTDTLRGNGGADTILGMDGNDTIYFDNLDTIDGGGGYDFATAGFSAGAITIYTAFVGIESVYGSLFNDTINAGSQAVRGEFWGYDGDDTISGTIYADYIHGGNGNDTLYVDGSDTIIGGAGIDFANAFYSATPVYFNTGALTIEGVYGSAFNDIINAGGQGVGGSFYGYEGNDIITSSNYADYIHGGNGFDYAAYNGNSTDYNWLFQNGIWYVGQLSTGVVDQLVSIEALRFLNGDVGLS